MISLLIDIIAIYFLISGIVIERLYLEETSDMTGFMLFGMSCLMALSAPFLAIVDPIKDAARRMDGWCQLRTFWYYLFNRKKMIVDHKNLEILRKITLKERNTGSIQDGLWRCAERLYFKVNNYKPQDT